MQEWHCEPGYQRGPEADGHAASLPGEVPQEDVWKWPSQVRMHGFPFYCNNPPFVNRKSHKTPVIRVSLDFPAIPSELLTKCYSTYSTSGIYIRRTCISSSSQCNNIACGAGGTAKRDHVLTFLEGLRIFDIFLSGSQYSDQSKRGTALVFLFGKVATQCYAMRSTPRCSS